MEVLVARVAGLDVHKKQVTSAVRTPDGERGRREEVCTVGTVFADLEALADWLEAEGVTQVVMESTGSYWKPVWAVLEDRGFDLLLVNARHVATMRFAVMPTNPGLPEHRPNRLRASASRRHRRTRTGRKTALTVNLDRSLKRVLLSTSKYLVVFA